MMRKGQRADGAEKSVVRATYGIRNTARSSNGSGSGEGGGGADREAEGRVATSQRGRNRMGAELMVTVTLISERTAFSMVLNTTNTAKAGKHSLVAVPDPVLHAGGRGAVSGKSPAVLPTSWSPVHAEEVGRRTCACATGGGPSVNKLTTPYARHGGRDSITLTVSPLTLTLCL